MAQKLPIGIQDFRTIITEGYKYIDKTGYVHALCNSGKFFFLSRPRRFGKSVTVALLEELYSGSRALFQGLWIEDKWDWSRKHPVIRLTLTGIGFPETGLPAALDYVLNEQIRKNKLEPMEGSLSNKFGYLIAQLARKGKVVVLVDEYDAPIIHYLGKDIQQAYINRPYQHT